MILFIFYSLHQCTVYTVNLYFNLYVQCTVYNLQCTVCIKQYIPQYSVMNLYPCNFKLWEDVGGNKGLGDRQTDR